MGFLLLLITGYFFLMLVVYNFHKVVYITLSESERKYLHEYYTTKFRYYRNLSPAKQQRFIYRVNALRNSNKIHVHDEIKHVHHDIEMMVNAAFAQITFGFNDFKLSSFSKIIIYPDSFYSKLAGAHVNGLTVGNGFIYLSWSHFLKGYQYHDDRINLALHELAHAIYIDRFHYSRDINWFLWEEKAQGIFEKISKEDHPFFRDYAKTNMAEFWAVCTECFFEDPINFHKEFPELYRHTARVLKQDLIGYY